MWIDSHQHFWLMSARQGEWPPAELAAIYRDFMPPDLLPILNQNKIGGTVIVQTLPSVADTEFMLNLADANPFILGVVGWVDMKADAAASQIARLARHPRFRGLRPMLQSIAEDDWISDPALDPAVAALIEHRLVFDALALPRHLRRVADFARRHPALPVIIDHGAKPLIASGRFSGWRADMAALAALPNVVCKLSGLLVEKGEQRPEAIRPYAETIFDLFGPERVIWGSDWPVVNLAADYGSWLAMCLDIVPAEHHKAVFAENAIRFYRLQLP